MSVYIAVECKSCNKTVPVHIGVSWTDVTCPACGKNIYDDAVERKACQYGVYTLKTLLLLLALFAWVLFLGYLHTR